MALRRLLTDLVGTYGDRFPQGVGFLARLDPYAGRLDALGKAGAAGGLGRAPLTMAQAERLGVLTGLPLTGGPQGSPGADSYRLWLSFARPELSPCLSKLEKAGEAYREALAMLTAGQGELRQNPEADMPGFSPCAEHQARADKGCRLGERERARGEALATQRKLYDPGLAPADRHGATSRLP